MFMILSREEGKVIIPRAKCSHNSHLIVLSLFNALKKLILGVVSLETQALFSFESVVNLGTDLDRL